MKSRLSVSLLALSMTVAALGVGCQGPRLPEPTNVVYPAKAEYGEDLDIVVQREGRSHIRVHNRTPVPYEGMVMWINQDYVRPIERLEIGHEKNRFDLTSWRNQYGEKYPVGSLLRPEQSRKVVLAELFDPVTGKRHRIIVRD
jgi:hypothetical protein